MHVLLTPASTQWNFQPAGPKKQRKQQKHADNICTICIHIPRLLYSPVHVLVKTICVVPASAYEAETASIFIGAQEAVPMINTLVEFGYSFGTPSRPTSPLPMTSSQPKFAWSILRRLTWYHWLKYRISQGQLNIFGEFGKQYCGKFFTKHHPLARH